MEAKSTTVIKEMLKAQLEVLDRLDNRLKVLEGSAAQKVPMLSGTQQKEIRDLIGTVSDYYLGCRKTAERTNFKIYLDREIISDVKAAFNVNTFDKIPCTRLPDVIRYVNNWKLSEECNELR